MSELKVVTQGFTPVVDRAVKLVWPNPRVGYILHAIDIHTGKEIQLIQSMTIDFVFGEPTIVKATLIDPESLVEATDQYGESYKHFYTYTEMWYLDEIVKE